MAAIDVTRPGDAGAQDGTVPAPSAAAAGRTPVVGGAVLRSGAPRPRTLAAAVIDALGDDTMTVQEIARQLAKRGCETTPAELAVCLRRMWTDGLLVERTILGVQCWRAR